MLTMIFFGQLASFIPLNIHTKDMNKERDFSYLVTVVRSTLSMMFGWLYL